MLSRADTATAPAPTASHARLPALREAASRGLVPLNTEVQLLPTQQTARIKAIALCKRIRRVQIQETARIDGHTNYIIKIFFVTPGSHIPTLRRVDRREPTDRPDVVLHQRFLEFVNLRHELHYHINAGHVTRLCDFCSNAKSQLTSGLTPPGLRLKLLHGDAFTCHALEGFVNAALELARTVSPASDGRLCHGQREIPLLILRFFSEGKEDKLPVQEEDPTSLDDARRPEPTHWLVI